MVKINKDMDGWLVELVRQMVVLDGDFCGPGCSFSKHGGSSCSLFDLLTPLDATETRRERCCLCTKTFQDA